MALQRHGLSIGIERVNDDIFLSFKAQGTLTHADYDTIVPMIESALSEVTHPHINAFIDGSELDGWEPRAAWDDLKLGLKHGSDFNKIAIYGDKPWQKLAAKVGGWFISGEVAYFDDRDKALNWLQQS